MGERGYDIALFKWCKTSGSYHFIGYIMVNTPSSVINWLVSYLTEYGIISGSMGEYDPSYQYEMVDIPIEEIIEKFKTKTPHEK